MWLQSDRELRATREKLRAPDLAELLRTRPFRPFRIHASDGRTYDVRHPDQALVLRTRVILPFPSDDEFPKRSEHLALADIVRAEEIPQAADSAK